MYLFWTPFYGIGILVIEYIFKTFNNKKKYIPIILFSTLTLLEFIGGYILEKMYGYSLWNYNMLPFHIGKYISIPSSLTWVIISYLYYYKIKKYSEKIINKIPKWITTLLMLTFISDLLLTLIHLYIIRM